MTIPFDPQALIVGAGPAGLAAALAMAERGVRDIAIIDRDDAPGGLPRFCGHPGFGWEYARRPLSGPGFVRYLLQRLEPFRIPIYCGTTMLSLAPGPTVSLTGPETGYREIGPKAVLVATGIREANRGNRVVVGPRPEFGVLTTGQLQQAVSRRARFPEWMRRIAVVGTEHVAFSAIWTAREAGLKVTTLLGPEDRVQSFAIAAWAAKLFGVSVHLGCSNFALEGDGRRLTAIAAWTVASEIRVPCDGVVFTGAWIPEIAALGTEGPLLDKRTGGPVIDQGMRTSIPGIFAAGNVLHPVESSGWAALEGRRAGVLLSKYLAGEIAAEQGTRTIEAGPGLEYLVPQRWDHSLAAQRDVPELRPTLRSSADFEHACLVLRSDREILWQGKPKCQMRKRRLKLDLSALWQDRSGYRTVSVQIIPPDRQT